MHDVLHDFPIFAPIRDVFRAISTPAGLDAWWTLESSGDGAVGTVWKLGFGPGYDWRATLRTFVADAEIEWEITEADADWTGSRVGLRLAQGEGCTLVQFQHRGWPADNPHYRTSCYCWAMYLRILKRHVEHGESVPYEKRLDV